MQQSFKISLILLFTICILDVYSVSDNNDTIPENHTGFSWGGSPILAYDTDLGLRYGAVINLFDYGDGRTFPKYIQYAKIKFYLSTRQSSEFSIVYDSDKLFMKSKFIGEFTYTKDIALDFYGFNGENTNIITDYITPEHQNYINKFYYNHQRKWLRIRFDIQKDLHKNGNKLYVGATYNNFVLQPVDPNIINIPTGINGNYFDTISLYQNYIEWGILSKKDYNGGNIFHLSAGYIIDTRNNQINCTDGIWLETYMLYSPNIFETSSFAKHIFTLRQYFHPPSNNITISYRISSQQKLWGNIPFYYLPVYFDSRINRDGLGGSNTLRGFYRNRIVANGFILGNFELRKKVITKQVFNIHCDFELSAFTDMAVITNEYKYNYENIPQDQKLLLINNNYQKYYISVGPGFYFIYNTNNIISVNYGISINGKQKTSGLYVGSSFVF